MDKAYTLLLADDEESIRRVLSITLSDSGYTVLTAEDGREALRVFREESPPIVLTDIKMPGITGVDLLRTIKKERPDTEVIMISGHGDMDLAIESLKHDATDFITKPINDDALEIALKRARERISMREQLRHHTDNLEALVAEQSAKLVEAERIAAVSRAFEGLSSAIWDIAGDMEGGIKHFNEMPCPVAIHSKDAKIVAANQLFSDRFGNRVGQDSWGIYRGESANPEGCPVARTLSSGEGQRSSEIVVYANQTDVQVIVHTAPIKDDAGHIELVLEISADIDEIRRLREELETTQDHLSSLGLKIGTISHGLKGLLTGLDGGAYEIDTGLSKEDSDRVKGGWDTVKLVIGRIRNMALDILYYAKERDLKWEAVDVLSFAEDVAHTIEPKAREHGVEFTREFKEETGDFEIDASVVRSALINILENAVDACVEDRKDGSRQVLFGAHQDGDAIVFTITDNGTGMDETTRENLFTLFFSSKGAGGTGLGLYISNQIINQHGGSISVSSTEGRGSTFRVSIPKVLPDYVKQSEIP